MSRKQRKSFFPGPWVGLIKTTMATPAWRAMSFGARLLYVEYRASLRNDARDNGKRWFSCRDAATALGTKSTRSIVRWFAENEHYGFMRKTGEGFLGAEGFGIAASYRLTEYAYGTNPPTQDFEKWKGEPFVYKPRRAQNPVSPRDTPRVPPGTYKERKSALVLMCPPGTHRYANQPCPPGTHI
jgi:hypothetical protein